MPSEIAVKMVTKLVNNAAGSILMAKYILQASMKTQNKIKTQYRVKRALFPYAVRLLNEILHNQVSNDKMKNALSILCRF
jgi:hypothetical protein